MPTKIKKKSAKSSKKLLLLKIEEKLTETLTEFPKKINEKKYKKVIHKAAIILAKDLTTDLLKAGSTKNSPVKAKKSELSAKAEPASEQIV